MKSRSKSLTWPVILTAIPLLCVIQVFQNSAVIAAPDTEAVTTCQRGTDEMRLLMLPGAARTAFGLRTWSLRPYLVHLPPTYDGTVPFPVVIDFHGGGGNKEVARSMTCPNGNLDDPGCLDRVADCEGFITVYPDGLSNPTTRTVRTFDAGGGAVGYACVSGYACSQNTDDIRFVTTLLDSIEKIYTIDPFRIYLTGISNGGAMAHRLACELTDRIAGIAPVAAGNQFSAIDFCYPTRTMPVLEIHGTEDRCWPYLGGLQTCGGNQSPGLFIPVSETVAGWASRNGCRPTPVVENLPNIDLYDGTTVTRFSYQGCVKGGDVVLLRINGGGHTWPGGSPYLPVWMVGKVSREFNASKVMWDFFKAHPMQ